MSCITLKKWFIEYDYHPKEDMGREHPGFDEEVEIHKVTTKGKNITYLVNIEKLADEVLDEIKSKGY